MYLHRFSAVYRFYCNMLCDFFCRLGGGAVGCFMKNEDGLLKSYADMVTMEAVAKFLALGEVALPAWVHFLAFDLTVGNYIVEKNIA